MHRLWLMGFFIHELNYQHYKCYSLFSRFMVGSFKSRIIKIVQKSLSRLVCFFRVHTIHEPYLSLRQVLHAFWCHKFDNPVLTF
jgi:hypothetical protein